MELSSDIFLMVCSWQMENGNQHYWTTGIYYASFLADFGTQRHWIKHCKRTCKTRISKYATMSCCSLLRSVWGESGRKCLWFSFFVLWGLEECVWASERQGQQFQNSFLFIQPASEALTGICLHLLNIYWTSLNPTQWGFVKDWTSFINSVYILIYLS